MTNIIVDDGYEATFSGDCDEDGNAVLEPGEEKECIITNDDKPAHINCYQKTQ